MDSKLDFETNCDIEYHMKYLPTASRDMESSMVGPITWMPPWRNATAHIGLVKPAIGSCRVTPTYDGTPTRSTIRDTLF